MRLKVEDFKITQNPTDMDCEVVISGYMSSYDASKVYREAVIRREIEIGPAVMHTVQLNWNAGFEAHIEKVIFNGPATIVYWTDGTKTVVRCQEGDTYDKEKGLALCYMKKMLGNKSGDFNKTLHKWLGETK